MYQEIVSFSQQINTRSKSTIEELENSLKSVQSYEEKH